MSKVTLKNGEEIKIPYVLMINDLGQGFTLDRGYKILHDSLENLGRDIARKLISVSFKSDSNWSPTGKDQIPQRFRRINRSGDSYYCKGFVAYWINCDDDNHGLDREFHGDKVVEAVKREVDEGITYHFDKWGQIQGQYKQARRELINEVRKNWRRDIGNGVFVGDTAFVRCYLSSDSGEDNCNNFNDRFYGSDNVTLKEFKSICEDAKKFLIEEGLKGVFHLSLEGSANVGETMEHFDQDPTPCGEYWYLKMIASIKN